MLIRLLHFVLLLIMVPFLFSCSSESSGEMLDGYYTAESFSFDEDGWKEYLTIYVSKNTIVTAEYNARNSSGFIKSWDVDHIRLDEKESGFNCNIAMREYTSALVNRQVPSEITRIAGDEHLYTSFYILAEAAIAQAKAGNHAIVIVNLP